MIFFLLFRLFFIHAFILFLDLERGDHADADQAERGAEHLPRVPEDPEGVGASDQALHRLQVCHGGGGLPKDKGRPGGHQPRDGFPED